MLTFGRLCGITTLSKPLGSDFLKTKLRPASGTGLLLLFAAAYFVSYLTRVNYATIISEMELATNFPRDLLSLALTGSFITYGAGQLVSGILGDLISPKKLLATGIGLTACMNLLLPLYRDPWWMLAVWCVNGFAQSFIWPPLVKLMTMLLPEKDYHKGVLWASYGCSLATILLYLLSPVVLRWFGWKVIFFGAAAVALVMLAVWLRYCPEPEAEAPVKTARGKGSRLLFAPVMLGIMLAIILHGMLKEGVSTWMPSYISDTYQLDNRIAILSGVIMPIFSVVSVKLSALVFKRFFKNPVACSVAVFSVSTLAALLLPLIGNAAASILLMALLTGSMHGINLMLISTIPPFFKKMGAVSTTSGLLNACTYIGSAASTYGIAVLSERFGWALTLWTWVAMAGGGLLLCLVCFRSFRKKIMEAA